MRGGGGTNASSTARGTDSATSATNPVNSEGEPVDDAFTSVAAAAAGTTVGGGGGGGVVGAEAPPGSDPAQRPQPRPYEALLAGSLEKFESGHQSRATGGGSGTVRAGARPATTGGTRRSSSQRRRPLSSGPASRSKPLERGENNGGGDGGEEGRGAAAREERRLEKTWQGRKRWRPRTACAGSGGVQGVLARMGGYEKVTVRPVRKQEETYTGCLVYFWGIVAGLTRDGPFCRGIAAFRREEACEGRELSCPRRHESLRKYWLRSREKFGIHLNFFLFLALLKNTLGRPDSPRLLNLLL